MRRVIVSVAAIFLSATGSAAQSVGSLVGVVVDSATRRPLANVEVRAGTVAGALTDSSGHFALRGIDAGRITISVRRIGYRSLEDTASIVAGQETTRELELTAQVALLDTVTTRAAGRRWSPTMRAFEERRVKGIGRFVTHSQLRRYDHSTLASALGQLGGTRIVSYRAGSYLMSTRGQSSMRGLPLAEPSDPKSPRGCWVAVYLDGISIYAGEPGNPPPDFRRLQARDYSGVEYYAGGASKPIEYSGVKASDCGVLLLWSREP